MTNTKTPPFNPYYSTKLSKLCPSVKWNIWKSLTIGKYPMPEEQNENILELIGSIKYLGTSISMIVSIKSKSV
ncbi:8769_t:CDS:2 [Ambispora gerdemannii]|uniref:8769_t:CDS:1 n=1 Tax=Ambispora gerdemannii TaxID=144530 RepID=A0A9N8ZUA3_9GLOM|nr:8769_t:CDS:2 [Ambispora gerdemannii]